MFSEEKRIKLQWCDCIVQSFYHKPGLYEHMLTVFIQQGMSYGPFKQLLSENFLQRSSDHVNPKWALIRIVEGPHFLLF